MGATARVWRGRIIGALAVAAGSVVLAALPVPLAVKLPVVAAGVALTLVLSFRLIPAFDPWGRVRWRLPAGGGAAKTCAITFDDGPTAGTAGVLDVLAEKGVKATFFVLAEN